KNFAKRFSDTVLLTESNINLHERNNIIKYNSLCLKHFFIEYYCNEYNK
ncbi:hypothetical protein ALC53_00007, partial [Atta colombica]